MTNKDHPAGNAFTPELLEATAAKLFGVRWASTLAAELDVSAQAVRNWATGRRAIPQSLVHRLKVIAIRRRGEVEIATRVLERLAEETDIERMTLRSEGNVGL